MKSVICFRNAVKYQHGTPILRIEDLSIREKESAAFFGLSSEIVELMVNQVTGVSLPDEGTVSALGLESRQILNDRAWFRFVQNFGIFNSKPVFQESASVGENLATLFRIRNENIQEPQLSACVLNLANRVHLTITDLSKTMGEASQLLRMKVRLSRSLAYRPKVVILCDPTEAMPLSVSRTLIDLIKRAKRKLSFTLLTFTSDVTLIHQLADRVVFLSPHSGVFIENQFREWYHRFFPFIKPSPTRVLQLTRDILQYGRAIRPKEKL